SARPAWSARGPLASRSPQTITMSSPRSARATPRTDSTLVPAAAASSSTTPPPPSSALSAARNASPAPGAKRATAAAFGSSADGQRADRALRAAQRARGLLDRPVPRHGPQLAAVADHRRGDPLVDVDRLVGEAPLVAQPAVVDLVVLARQHAQHALVADGERD